MIENSQDRDNEWHRYQKVIKAEKDRLRRERDMEGKNYKLNFTCCSVGIFFKESILVNVQFLSPIKMEELPRYSSVFVQIRALFCRKSTLHWTLLLQQVSWAQHQGEQFADQPCFSEYNSYPKNSSGQAEGIRGCTLCWTMLPLQENGRGEGIQKH